MPELKSRRKNFYDNKSKGRFTPMVVSTKDNVVSMDDNSILDGRQ